MPRFIALLRGINVGGHRVKMDRLRELFRDFGFEDVSTYIASGNVLFTTPEEDAGGLEVRVEKHLERNLAFPVPTFLRTREELVSAAAFEKSAESVYVIFLRGPVDPDTRRRLTALETNSDRFAFVGREVFWLIDGKVSESPLFGSAIAKALGGADHTTRNMTTVRKLADR